MSPWPMCGAQAGVGDGAIPAVTGDSPTRQNPPLRSQRTSVHASDVSQRFFTPSPACPPLLYPILFLLLRLRLQFHLISLT